MNNGRWALVTGNGYNSADERAVLLIQYLDKGKELFKIATEGGDVWRAAETGFPRRA